MNKVKIIQFQAMPNNEYYQGATIGLGDDGVMYSNTGKGWEVYHELRFEHVKEHDNFDSDYLKSIDAI
jgi:hypothetical protein